MERKHSVMAIVLSITVAIATTIALCFATILGLNRLLSENAFVGFNKLPMLWGGLTASAVPDIYLDLGSRQLAAGASSSKASADVEPDFFATGKHQ